MPAIVKRKLNSLDVIDVLAELFLARGIPGHIRSVCCRSGLQVDRGGGRKDGLHRTWFAVGERLRRELQSRLRDELLNGGIFYSLREAQIVIESWRRHYNAVRPHQSLGSNRRRRRFSFRRLLHGLTRRLRPLPRPRSI